MFLELSSGMVGLDGGTTSLCCCMNAIIIGLSCGNWPFIIGCWRAAFLRLDLEACCCFANFCGCFGSCWC